MKYILSIALLFALSSCWPTKVAFVDSNMPEEWKTFYVTPLENNAANTPLSYSTELSESIRDGVQNNSRLLINSDQNAAEVIITGTIANYLITPVALQSDDNASQNRLTVTVQFEILISKPKEEIITMTSSRFVDFDVDTDIGIVEGELLTQVNEQIVQDVLNKLMSNW